MQHLSLKYAFLLSCTLALTAQYRTQAMDIANPEDTIGMALIAFNITQINAISHGTGLSYTGYNNKGGSIHAACYNDSIYQASVTPDNRDLIGCPGKIYAFLEAKYKKQQEFLKLHK